MKKWYRERQYWTDCIERGESISLRYITPDSDQKELHCVCMCSTDSNHRRRMSVVLCLPRCVRTPDAIWTGTGTGSSHSDWPQKTRQNKTTCTPHGPNKRNRGGEVWSDRSHRDAKRKREKRQSWCQIRCWNYRPWNFQKFPVSRLLNRFGRRRQLARASDDLWTITDFSWLPGSSQPRSVSSFFFPTTRYPHHQHDYQLNSSSPLSSLVD